MKTNWDVAINTTTNISGLGGLMRYSNREVLVSFCCSINSLTKLKLAEALALRKAMSICWELELPNVLFEGDCLQVIKADTTLNQQGMKCAQSCMTFTTCCNELRDGKFSSITVKLIELLIA